MLTVTKDGQDAPATGEAGALMLDEIVREGARRVLAAALEAEVAAYIEAKHTATSSMRMVTGWWCATGATNRGRC